MKWGVRRFQKKDGTLTSAGKKRYSDDSDTKKADENQSENSEHKQKKKLTRKQKAIIIGASVVAVYATYKFVDSGHAAQMIAKGKAALGHGSLEFKKDMNLSNKNLSSDELFSTVVKRINPGYGGVGTKNNCRRCTFAYEMSRRGYDVRATKTISGTGQTIIGLSSATSKGSGYFNYLKTGVTDPESITAKSFFEGNTLGAKAIVKGDNDSGFSKSIFKTLSGYQDGARGELTAAWSSGGVHSMAWEIVKGKPVIFDCQTGTKYDSPDVFNTLGDVMSKASITRLDNVDLNNDFLLRWLQNA